MTSIDELPDFDEMWAILEYIEEHESEWDQSAWAFRHPTCGTTLCFAGFAVTRAGYTLMWGSLPHASFCADLSAEQPEDEWIEVVARRVLRLNESEAERLFRGANTLDDLRVAIRVIEASYGVGSDF